MSASTPAAAGKKPAWYKRILGWIPIAVVLIIVIVAFRSCSGSTERADDAVPTARAAKGPFLGLGGRRLADGSATVEASAPAPAAAKAIVLNRLCAPFSMTTQMCKVEPSPSGTDYIGFAHDAPDGARLCTLPGDDPDTVKPEDRLIKETWYLLADGKEVKKEEGKPLPDNVLAIKKIVNRPVTLVYYLAIGSCTSTATAPAA